jgi:hypothetical protein
MSQASRLAQIAEEHATIRATVLRIELELDRLLARPSEPGETWKLPELVQSFRKHLIKHFELEESGGLLGDAAAYFEDTVQDSVRERVAEHRHFEEALGRICDELDQHFVPGATVQGCFDGELRRLIQRLARHEAAENDLLRKALQRTDDDEQAP